MIEDYKIITITHKSAALKDIGQFVLPISSDNPLPQRLEALKNKLAISELLYLPTCNRVLFFFCHQGNLDSDFLKEFTEVLYPDWDARNDVFITHEGEAALRHLFEVSASVDSLVVGEREIIRQLRQAYGKCHEEKLTSDSIRLAMDATVRTAKRVYARTRIGEKQVSIVSLAVKKLLESGLSPNDRILIIGAGQTNALVCKFLKKYKYSKVTIFNRTLAKAEKLAELTQGRAFPLSELQNYQEGFDGIVVCTSSIEPVLNVKTYSQLLQGERTKKVVVDLAIPNNVSEETSSRFDMEYIEIDGLKVLAQKNLAFRTQEVSKAKEIIEAEIRDYHSLYRERQLERAFHNMPKRIKAVKEKAMKEVFVKEMDNLDEDAKELLERMLTYMEKKCISIPMKVAKDTILP